VIAMLMSAALAQSPRTSGPVDQLVWARPFTLSAPEADPNNRGAQLSEGWIVEIRADPALMIPSDVNEPWLYVGEQRAMKLNWDWEGGCLVAVVSGRPDLAATPMFFGVQPGPTTTDAERQALARSEADRQAIRPLPADQVAAALAAGGPALQAHDLRDVVAAGRERVAACTKTPADLQRR
jgi:hypothetical protein